MFALVLLAGGAVLWPQWVTVRDATIESADAHVRYEVSHPGWSFPSTVWSAAAPLDLPPQRLAMQARARDYEEACPPAEPGQYCAEDGAVIPRGGHFPEGMQPPGRKGWTRPLALEPVAIGTLIGPDAELREHLPLDQAPKVLLAAIVAAEDEDFFHHHGVDLRGTLRAAWVNSQDGGYKQGASTLTMQVVRNLSQDKEKTLSRKLREAAAAVALDRHLGKEGVLQAYLDAPYLGQDGSLSICGFRAAARYYYGIDATDLNMSQAATLAAILPAPGRFAPDRHPDLARQRRDAVLDRMEKAGWDVGAARTEPIVAEPHARPANRFPAYLQAVRSWSEANLGPGALYGSGLDVWTALDVVAQEQSDALVPKRVAYLEHAVGAHGEGPLEAAGAIVDSRTGYLVAVYGGTRQAQTDFNRATQARRQPGSSIKPLVYAMALAERGPDGKPRYTAASTMRNSRGVFPGTDGWNPRNVGGGYTTTATLSYGLAWSQNIATASLLQDAGGPARLKAFGTKLGFDTKSWPEELGLALGQGEVTPLEMARFVASVIADGHLAGAWPVVQVTDPSGRVRLQTTGLGDTVIPDDAAALTRGLMRAVIEQGTGGASRGSAGFPGYGGPAIGKTGTTDSEKDLWFIGGTPDYSLAVWLGYDQPVRIGASASDLAAPLWGWWMRALEEGLPHREFTGAVKTESRAVCLVTGKLSNGTCPLIGTPFLPGTEPKDAAPSFTSPSPKASSPRASMKACGSERPGKPPSRMLPKGPTNPLMQEGRPRPTRRTPQADRMTGPEAHMAQAPNDPSLQQRVWADARSGQARAVVGAQGGVPAAPEGWWTVRVRCDGPPRMLGPVIEAQRQVDRLVGSRTPVMELAADRLRSGLRRRLLGEESETAWPADGDMVAELNRLSDSVDGPAALVFEAVEAADAATLAFLGRVVHRPGWLRPALILGMRAVPTTGPLSQLVDRMRNAEGQAVVVPADDSPALSAAPELPEFPELPPNTRRVLRAASVVGAGFEVSLVARLLDLEPMAVLEALQHAWDAGVPLEDLGEGRFHMPARVCNQLRAELLPTLASSWNRSLARMLAGEETQAAAEPAEVPIETTPQGRVTDRDPGEPPPIADAEARGRSARHAAQAGDVDVAVQRYIDAARGLADQGAIDQALAYATEALSLLERLPRTPERRRLAALALATTGRMRWQVSGGADFTLDAATRELERALELLADTDDVPLRAEIRRLLAAVAYDRGDDKSLDRALAELTEATRELSRAGDARPAARLLNDQAAVLVAMGDPVRASHLLEESLQTFQVLAARAAREARREGRGLTPDEAADRCEVAETRHLMARLPLCVEAKPGQQQAAFRKAAEHAAEAEEIYEALGMQRELGRVWQTHGQLTRLAGDLGAARELLNRASRAQLNLGDAIGLAQTTQTIAGLLGDRREHAEALRLLVDSIRLNQGKGSPRGLAWNRQTLDELAQRMTEHERDDLAPMIMAVRRQLEAAEGQLGRVALPLGSMT